MASCQCAACCLSSAGTLRRPSLLIAQDSSWLQTKCRCSRAFEAAPPRLDAAERDPLPARMPATAAEPCRDPKSPRVGLRLPGALWTRA